MRLRVLIALVAAAFAWASLSRGRSFALERGWLDPFTRCPAPMRDARGVHADPRPAAGARVLRPMSLERSRAVLRAMTARDPLVVTVGTIGRDGDAELHLRLRNRGRCRVVAYAGVAYGFDAWGDATPVNAGGEHYLAFARGDHPVDPGRSTQEAWSLRHGGIANLAIAHVDEVRCADGTVWRR